MDWQIEWDEYAFKQVQKLDRSLQKTTVEFLKKRLKTYGDPRKFGKPLSYDKHGLWRYRLGKIRIICSIEDDSLTILIVKIGQRKNIYESL